MPSYAYGDNLCLMKDEEGGAERAREQTLDGTPSLAKPRQTLFGPPRSL